MLSRQKLLPLATVLALNLHEAGALTGREIKTLAHMKEAARAIREFGPKNVVVNICRPLPRTFSTTAATLSSFGQNASLRRTPMAPVVSSPQPLRLTWRARKLFRKVSPPPKTSLQRRFVRASLLGMATVRPIRWPCCTARRD